MIKILKSALLLSLAVCGEIISIDRNSLKNNGNIFYGKVGDVFDIKLDSNPSTGYDWYLQNDVKNNKFLKGSIINDDNSGYFV